MLSVNNVSKTYAGRTLFANVGFHIQRGDKIGLIGPNGAGKSTLFSLLMGDGTPDEGMVNPSPPLVLSPVVRELLVTMTPSTKAA